MTPRAHAAAVRALLWGLLLAYLVKLHYFILGARIYHLRPLEDPFFPSLLQQLPLAIAAYLAPVLLTPRALLSRSSPLQRLALLTFVLSSLVLLIHQQSYNDATFVTTLWTSAIGLWFARRPPVDPLAAPRLARLTLGFIGMLFIGGLSGKLTPGYLDGEVIHGIYFVDRQHLTFDLARRWLSADQLRDAARLYSRMILGAEALLASLPLWPARTGLWVGLLGLLGLMLLNNILLASVIAGPCALAITALWLLRSQGANLAASRPDVRLEEISI